MNEIVLYVHYIQLIDNIVELNCTDFLPSGLPISYKGIEVFNFTSGYTLARFKDFVVCLSPFCIY